MCKFDHIDRGFPKTSSGFLPVVLDDHEYWNILKPGLWRLGIPRFQTDFFEAYWFWAKFQGIFPLLDPLVRFQSVSEGFRPWLAMATTPDYEELSWVHDGRAVGASLQSITRQWKPKIDGYSQPCFDVFWMFSWKLEASVNLVGIATQQTEPLPIHAFVKKYANHRFPPCKWQY